MHFECINPYIYLPPANGGRSGSETHVWTAPSTQGFLTFGAAVGCGHVSGLFLRFMTAGPDAIRSLAPNHFHALS